MGFWSYWYMVTKDAYQWARAHAWWSRGGPVATAVLAGTIDYFSGAHSAREAGAARAIGLAAGLLTWVAVFIIGAVSAPSRLHEQLRAKMVSSSRDFMNTEFRLQAERDAAIDKLDESTAAHQRAKSSAFADAKIGLDLVVAEGHSLISAIGPQGGRDGQLKDWISRATSFVDRTFGAQQAARVTCYDGMTTPHSGMFAMATMHLARLNGLRTNLIAGTVTPLHDRVSLKD